MQRHTDVGIAANVDSLRSSTRQSPGIPAGILLNNVQMYRIYCPTYIANGHYFIPAVVMQGLLYVKHALGVGTSTSNLYKILLVN